MTHAFSIEMIDGLVLIAVLTIISSIALWIAGRLGFYRLPPASVTFQPAPVSFWEVMGAFVTFLAAEILAVPLFYFAWKVLHGERLGSNEPLDAQTQGIINLAAIACSAVFVGIFCFFSRREVIKAVFGENFWVSIQRSVRDFFIGVSTWLLAYPLVGLVSQIFGLFLFFVYRGPQIEQVAVKHLKGVMEMPLLFWISVVLIGTVVPILEEILFRGFLQTWLTRMLGVGKGIAFTALIFALFHFSSSQGIENIELLAALFTLACFLGYLRERQRSLWAPIGLHATFNSVSMLLIANSHQA